MKFWKKIFKKEKAKDDAFSKFIKELRKEKNLTQYDLADLIPISREAVSKWERNTTKPNKASLDRLSEIFDITPDELLLGKRLSDLEKEELQKLTTDLYKQKNHNRKMFKISLVIIFVLIFSFLAFYFVTSYNSIKVYRLKYNQDNTIITNGIFVTTRKRFYFNVGDIETDEEILSLRLYYKNKKNEDVKIYFDENDYLFIYDNYGYNAYFKYKDVKYVLKNMYLDIEYADGIKTIKLDFYQDFANSLFSKDEKIEIVDSKENKLKFDFSEELIKRKFTQMGTMYLYDSDDDNLNINYMENVRVINVTKNHDNIMEEWNYSFNSNNLEYLEYQDGLEINYYDYSNNCNSKCLDKMNEFYDLMAKILE